MMRSKLFSLAVLALFAGCDPCAGVASCGDLWVQYEGEVWSRSTDGPVGGARVRLVRTSGGQLESDTIFAETDPAGVFRLRSRATSTEPVVGTLHIEPVGGTAIVREVELSPTPSRSEVKHLGRWEVRHPFFGSWLEVVWRGRKIPAENVEVEFLRQSGVDIVPNPMRMTSDHGGRVYFTATPLGVGASVGRLTLTPPAPHASRSMPNFELEARLKSGEPLAGQFWVGSHLPYVILVVWSDTGEPAAGVEVNFRRTGGLQTIPEEVGTVSSASSFANVEFAPVTVLGTGDVVGEITVTPPAPHSPIVLSNLVLRAYEEDVPTYWRIDIVEIPR